MERALCGVCLGPRRERRLWGQIEGQRGDSGGARVLRGTSIPVRVIDGRLTGHKGSLEAFIRVYVEDGVICKKGNSTVGDAHLRITPKDR